MEMVYTGTCYQGDARRYSPAGSLFPPPRANYGRTPRAAGSYSHLGHVGSPLRSSLLANKELPRWQVAVSRWTDIILFGRPPLWLKKVKSIQLSRLNCVMFNPVFEFLPTHGWCLMAWPLGHAEGQLPAHHNVWPRSLSPLVCSWSCKLCSVPLVPHLRMASLHLSVASLCFLRAAQHPFTQLLVAEPDFVCRPLRPHPPSMSSGLGWLHPQPQVTQASPVHHIARGDGLRSGHSTKVRPIWIKRLNSQTFVEAIR